MYADDSQLSVSPNIEEDELTAVMQLQKLIARTSGQHAKVLFDSLSESRTIIPGSPCVKDLGVIIDELTLNNHITYICKSCYHYLRNIHTVRPHLTTSSAKTIVHSVISAKLDYCNSLFVDIPDFLSDFYHVQNAAARIVLNLKDNSVAHYLMKLHLLPIRHHIIYKLNLLVFMALKAFNPCFA